LPKPIAVGEVTPVALRSAETLKVAPGTSAALPSPATRTRLLSALGFGRPPVGNFGLASVENTKWSAAMMPQAPTSLSMMRMTPVFPLNSAMSQTFSRRVRPLAPVASRTTLPPTSSWTAVLPG
jgi:hypothetical protein